MSDEKLKQELFYMVRLTSKYDFSKMEVVEGILRLENERKILDSVFGRRFKTRIFDIAAGLETDGKCVICGNPAENNVICKHCMESIGGSEYAKSRTKPEEVKTGINKIFSNIHFPKIKFFKIRRPEFISKQSKEEKVTKEKVRIKAAPKRLFQYVLIVCLIIILFIQIWMLSILHSLPSRPKPTEPIVSSNELVEVKNVDEAMAQIAKDFTESEGYTITFGRMDTDYVGRFLINTGDCCEEVEEQLTDEERYDYFFKEDVYVFYVSCQQENLSKVGVVEINSAGSILVIGDFNDGRRTDVHYKIR